MQLEISICSPRTILKLATLKRHLLLALGLTAIGKTAKFVVCDGALSACQMCEFDNIAVAELQDNGPQSGFAIAAFDMATHSCRLGFIKSG